MVIVHPEESIPVQKDLSLLKKIAKLGCRFAVTLSVGQGSGKKAAVVREILLQGYPYVPASNAENARQYRQFLEALDDLLMEKKETMDSRVTEEATPKTDNYFDKDEAEAPVPDSEKESVLETREGFSITHNDRTDVEELIPEADTELTIQKEIRSPKRKKRIVLLSILALLLAGLVFGGVFLYRTLKKPEHQFRTSQQRPQSTQKSMVESLPQDGEPAQETLPIVITEEGIVNILLLGIDSDDKSYAKDGGDFHTDAIINVAINFNKGTVDLISLPRDTFTHVPGVRGIYKLNAAINCGGGKTEEGFLKVCEAASWLLGGIQIDYYAAFELDTVIAIGNLIGGVDFDMDMAYTGNSGRSYEKGMQHLDGTGIYDYMRARKNARYSISGDAGRMERSRKMLVAIFEKMKQENLLAVLPSLIGEVKQGLYTNVSIQQMMSLAGFALEIDTAAIGSHTMKGKIRNALNWNFWFIDQVARQALIEQVYGVTVAPLERVSYEYATWMGRAGFLAVRHLTTAMEVYRYACDIDIAKMTEKQRLALAQMEEDYRALQAEYEKESDMPAERNLKSFRDALKESTEELARLIDYPNRMVWSLKSSWCEDECINEVIVDFN